MQVDGRVTDASDGGPLPEARVVLEIDGRTVAVRSDASGGFTWRDDALQAAGRVDYRVEKPGFETLTGSREDPGGELRLEVGLQPREAPADVAPEPADAPPEPAAAAPEPPNRFEAVRQHPDYASIAGDRPSTFRWHAANVGIMVVGGIFGGVGLVMLAIASSDGMGGFALVGFLPMAVGAGVVLWGLVRFVRFTMAPLRRKVARVVDKRTEVSGGGESSASTSYYLTLEFEDGERAELETKGEVTGLVAADDMGVAFSKGGILIDFRRVAV